MAETIMKEKLANKLEEYFNDKDTEINGIVNTFSDFIFKYVDCDYDALIDALDQFIEGRKNGLSKEILAGRSSFDVSIDNSKLSVKTFFHKEFPAIYFFRNGEKSSFLKIKQEKKDGANIYKASYKSSENENAKTYEKDKVDFVVRGETSQFKNAHEKYSNASHGDAADLKNLPSHQQDFLELLSILLEKNNVHFDKNLSEGGKDIIFGSLYHKALEAIGFSEELRVNEVLRVLLETLYQKEGISDVSKSINARGGDSSKFYANNGRPISLGFSGGTEHMFLEAYNEQGGKVAIYNIFKTTEGFTIYRNYLGEMRPEEAPFSTITINLSKNVLKFSVLGRTMIVSPIEFMMEFGEDGRLSFSSNENIVLKNNETNLISRRFEEVEEKVY